jgi:peptidoglycan/xylan/chitin deacetylase (PgdA/CDA1 family)
MNAMEMLPAFAAAGGVCAAAGVFSWAAVAPSSQLFGPTVRHTGEQATIALTFDDGPNPALTPSFLELLDRHAVKATFFLIGKWVSSAPALAAEISAAGHTVGNHTNTHPGLALCSPARISVELDRCDEAIGAATGERPRSMRPPYGFRGPQLAPVVRKRGGAAVVMWSAMARDWKPQAAETVIERLRRVRGGDIVLLHDGDPHEACADRSHTALALEYWIPRWKDAGMRFATVDEILTIRGVRETI